MSSRETLKNIFVYLSTIPTLITICPLSNWSQGSPPVPFLIDLWRPPWSTVIHPLLLWQLFFFQEIISHLLFHALMLLTSSFHSDLCSSLGLTNVVLCGPAGDRAGTILRLWVCGAAVVGWLPQQIFRHQGTPALHQETHFNYRCTWLLFFF